MNDVSEELRAFLDYVGGKNSDDAYVMKLQEAVKRAQKNRGWRYEYMTLLMRDQENIEKGIEQGIQALIESFKELGIPFSKSLKLLMKKFSMTEDIAQKYMDKYWR